MDRRARNASVALCPSGGDHVRAVFTRPSAVASRVRNPRDQGSAATSPAPSPDLQGRTCSSVKHDVRRGESGRYCKRLPSRSAVLCCLIAARIDRAIRSTCAANRRGARLSVRLRPLPWILSAPASTTAIPAVARSSTATSSAPHSLDATHSRKQADSHGLSGPTRMPSGARKQRYVSRRGRKDNLSNWEQHNQCLSCVRGVGYSRKKSIHGNVGRARRELICDHNAAPAQPPASGNHDHVVNGPVATPYIWPDPPPVNVSIVTMFGVV